MSNRTYQSWVEEKMEQIYCTHIYQLPYFQVSKNGWTKTCLYSLFSLAFKIDSSDGTITTKQTFDYEDMRLYFFTVLVEDGGTTDIGTPDPRRGMANVTVTITDENDNNPIFLHNATEVEIYEVNLQKFPEKGMRPVMAKVGGVRKPSLLQMGFESTITEVEVAR